MEKKLSNNYNIASCVQSSCCNQDSLSMSFLSNIKTKEPVVVNDDGFFGVREFKNNYKQSHAFWIAATNAGLFNQMFHFHLLKFRDNYQRPERRGNPLNDTKLNEKFYDSLPKENNHCDKTGGFIHRGKIKQIARQLHISYHTLRGVLPKLEKTGLIIKTVMGWNMISMQDAALMVGVDLLQLKIKANSKSELKDKLSLYLIKTLKRKINRATDKTLCTNDVPVVLSCLQLAKRLGYKSATTGSRRERELECKGKIIVQRFVPVKETLVDSLGNYLSERFKQECNKIRIIKCA